MTLASDFIKFQKKTEQKLEDVVLASLFKLNQNVIKRTPVDEGRARGGWIASLDRTSSGKGRSDKIGAKTLKKANAIANKAIGHIYYLTNNVSYIRVLEFGEYPNPPLTGNKTTGGYSKQAPAGMARLSIIELKREIQRQVQSVGSR